jgi:hypothetical protein
VLGAIAVTERTLDGSAGPALTASTSRPNEAGGKRHST